MAKKTTRKFYSLRNCALKKTEANHGKKTTRKFYRRLRSCALKKRPRQTMAKKTTRKFIGA